MLTRLLFGCAIALGLIWMGAYPGLAADDAAYSVVIKNVEVHKTKANGEPWDVNDGKPDVAVSVRNVDDKEIKAFETPAKTDTFTGEFNTPTPIKVRADQSLEFEVVDKDAALNDSIGKMAKKITAEELKSGKMRLENFGRVIFLEVEFKKL